MQGTDENVYGLNIVLAPGDILCQMGPDSMLSLGTCLYSPGRAIRLEFQLNDGNAVLKYLETATLPRVWANAPLSGNDPLLHWIPFWSPRTDNHSAETLIMQPDGNLVVYDGQGTGFLGLADARQSGSVSQTAG